MMKLVVYAVLLISLLAMAPVASAEHGDIGGIGTSRSMIFRGGFRY
jgi:hypothetical protein